LFTRSEPLAPEVADRALRAGPDHHDETRPKPDRVAEDVEGRAFAARHCRARLCQLNAAHRRPALDLLVDELQARDLGKSREHARFGTRRPAPIDGLGAEFTLDGGDLRREFVAGASPGSGDRSATGGELAAGSAAGASGAGGSTAGAKLRGAAAAVSTTGCGIASSSSACGSSGRNSQTSAAASTTAIPPIAGAVIRIRGISTGLGQ
jgi:hypothetical protein